jgi:hypothetical protein
VTDEQRLAPRVMVTRPMVGLVHMQVCACKDATNEEILEVCNRDNPAGTSGGWATVCRNTGPEEFWGQTMPTQCADDPGRMHFLVGC